MFVKETISEDKELLWWSDNKWITDDVRKKLKIKGGKVAITPSNVPAGTQLFVNSTSSNRKVH